MVSEREDTEMSEYEISRVFPQNLRKYMERNGESQYDISRLLGVSQATVSMWLSGARTPKLSMIERLCDHYHITRSELLDDKSDKETYYTDINTQQIAQEIFESKEMRGLFYAAKDLSPEKLRLLQQLCKQLKDS